jgi:hypothetical protein
MKYKMGFITVLKLEPYHGDKKYITNRLTTLHYVPLDAVNRAG